MGLLLASSLCRNCGQFIYLCFLCSCLLDKGEKSRKVFQCHNSKAKFQKGLDDFEVEKSSKSRSRPQRKITRKLPPPFPNGWYVIAESKEIKSGDVKSVDCLGENFVVFRSTTTEEVFVLDAFCTHLGANLGIGGRIVNNNCIECPFHQWKFSGVDGTLQGIPYSSNTKDCKIHT